MQPYYEIIELREDVPINLFLHSTNEYMMHIHKELEIILVVEGSINIRVVDKEYLLKENDLILINPGEAHSTSRTIEDNTCLVFQLDPKSIDFIYPLFSKVTIDCKSFDYGKEEQGRFDIIRKGLAKMLKELSKKAPGYQLKIGSETLLLIKGLLHNFDHAEINEASLEESKDNIIRMNRIIRYIDENLYDLVTLEDIANLEGMSIYYLSRLFKNSIGMTFQEYKNQKRVDKAVRLLTDTNETITSIAFQSGFPSIKALNTIFKRNYGCTPSEFRQAMPYSDREIDLYKEKIKSKSYLDVDRRAALKKLYSYLDSKDSLEEDDPLSGVQDFHLDTNKEGRDLNHYWQELTTFGRAAEGLKEAWRDQFRELQRKIGFKYVRFHGIFHDDMMIYNTDSDGNVIYNWNYVNDLFDFFMEVNIKPFIELGFMPRELKSGENHMYWWKANVSQPKDINLWTELVREFVKHCVRRYGLKEVESWYFEVWNEPELEQVFWIGSREEYFEFYKETVLAVKSVSEKIRVGGPSITHESIKYGTWLEDFMIYCSKNQVPLDMITMHIYPESFGKEDAVQELLLRMANKENLSQTKKEIIDESLLKLLDRFLNGENLLEIIKSSTEVKSIYHEKDHTPNTLRAINDKIKEVFPSSKEIHIVEWSSTAFGRNLISDTCYTSTFIVRNILESIGLADSIGYWVFTDIFEEMIADKNPFHGGFGLINQDGIKKAGYYAYWLLSKLGDKIIHKEDDFIVTKKDEGIQILAYNYAYFDDIFLSGDTSSLNSKSRYDVYEHKDNLNLNINLKGLNGEYRLRRYILNRENGSAFDEWIKIGSPDYLTTEEVAYLKARSQPTIRIEEIKIENEIKCSFSIPVHGIELLVLEKQI